MSCEIIIDEDYLIDLSFGLYDIDWILVSVKWWDILASDTEPLAYVEMLSSQYNLDYDTVIKYLCLMQLDLKELT